MICLNIIGIASFDCFMTIFIYFMILLMGFVAIAKLLKA